MVILEIAIPAIVVWFACGILAFGNHLAAFQFKYPMVAQETWESDFRDAVGAFFFGPIALAVGISMGDWKYGLLFNKPYMMHWRVEQLKKQPLSARNISTFFDTMNQIIGREFGRGPHKND